MFPVCVILPRGELKDTVVFRIESWAYLKKLREDNGWHINWNEVPTDVEVYALALHDNNEAELVKHYEEAFGAVHIGILHEYQIAIDGEASRKLLEVYSYEWNGNKKNS